MKEIISTNPLTGNLCKIGHSEGDISSYWEKLKQGEVIESVRQENELFKTTITVLNQNFQSTTLNCEDGLQQIQNQLIFSGASHYPDGSVRFITPNLNALLDKYIIKLPNIQTGNIATLLVFDNVGVKYTEHLKDGSTVVAYEDEDGDCNAYIMIGDEGFEELTVFGHSCLDDALAELEATLNDLGSNTLPNGTSRFIHHMTEN